MEVFEFARGCFARIEGLPNTPARARQLMQQLHRMHEFFTNTSPCQM